MVESDAYSTDLDEPATGITAVWVYFAITLVVSAAIVYVIGDRLNNPDAAILTVSVPSTVAIGITARTSGWIGVRSFLRLGGKGPGSASELQPRSTSFSRSPCWPRSWSMNSEPC